MSEMTDRELLELAAKAAGLTVLTWNHVIPALIIAGPAAWNPLEDDGDAFRLAVKLSMNIEISEDETSTYAYAGDTPRAWAMELWRDDRYAATRRAIVRAAAAIGAKS